MKPHPWLPELIKLSILLSVAMVAGLLLGEPWLGLAIGLAIALSWHTYQALHLLAILNSKKPHLATPAHSGLWQALTEKMLLLHKQSRKQKKMTSRFLQRLRDASQAMPDAIILLGDDNRIEFSNQAAYRLLNIHWPDAKGKKLSKLIALPELGRYLKNEKRSEPLEFTPPANRSLRLAISSTKFGKKRYQRLVVVRDITKIHHLDNTRRDFVANASHELRTPLTVIHGYLEALSEESVTPERIKQPLQLMLQQTQRMQGVITDLLTLSRLETDPSSPDRHPLNIPRLLREIIDSAQSVAAKSQHQIYSEIDDNLWLKGTAEEIQSIASNLLFNAIQHTPNGTDIRVQWQQRERHPLLSIQDSAGNIDERHIPRLTERFYRVDSARSRETGGTGLGLAIVKQVMLRYGGDLYIHSEPGVSTTFNCNFPSSLALHPDRV